MPKKTQMKYESESDSESDSDTEMESKKQIMRMLKKHSKKHGAGIAMEIKHAFEKKHGKGIFDDIGGFVNRYVAPAVQQHVTPYVTDKKGLASDVLQFGLPSAMGAVGSMGGPAGSVAAKQAGKLLAKKIAEDNDMSRRDVSISTGMGIHIDVNSHNASGSKAKTGMGFFDDLANDLRPIRGIGGHGLFDDLRGIVSKAGDVVDRGVSDVSDFVQREKKTTGGPAKRLTKDVMKGVKDVMTDVDEKAGMGLRSRKKSKDHVSRRAFDEYIKNEMERMSRKDVAEARAVRAGKKAKPAGGYGYGLKGSPEMAERMAKLRAMRKKK
jgi:hypothetical protein